MNSDLLPGWRADLRPGWRADLRWACFFDRLLTAMTNLSQLLLDSVVARWRPRRRLVPRSPRWPHPYCGRVVENGGQRKRIVPLPAFSNPG